MFFTLLACSLAARADEPPRRVFVPFDDLDAVIRQGTNDPWGFVLLPKAEVASLLKAAEEYDARRGTAPLAGQAAITGASYTLTIDADRARLIGIISLRSEREGWTSLKLISHEVLNDPRLAGRFGVRSALLDERPAPLGRSAAGDLMLFIERPGSHRLTLEMTVTAEQLPTGLRVIVPLPRAALAELSLDVAGDVTLATAVPQTQIQFDKATSRTRGLLAVGGLDRLELSIEGNGRHAADNATLLSETVSRVSLSTERAGWRAEITVEILRRGVRELELSVPEGWNYVSVSHADLQAWSLKESDAGDARRIALTFRRPIQGRQTLVIEAEQPVSLPDEWTFPHAGVAGAIDAFGVWRVEPARGVLLRGESLTSVRRLNGDTTGAMYYAWGTSPRAVLRLEREAARAELDRSLRWTVGEDGLTLAATLRLTVRQGELFGATLTLPAELELSSLRINRPEGRYRHRIEPGPDGSMIRVEWIDKLAGDQSLDIELAARMVPRDWEKLSQRVVELPSIVCDGFARDEGVINVVGIDDLALRPMRSDGLKPLSAQDLAAATGRPASPRADESLGYSFRAAGGSPPTLTIQISRRSPLITGRVVNFAALSHEAMQLRAQIDFTIASASVDELFLRLPPDASASTQFAVFDSTGREVPIAERAPLLAPGNAASAPIEQGVVWSLKLAAKVRGDVRVRVDLESPFVRTTSQPALPASATPVPLVWPESVESFTGFVAVEGRDEMELKLTPGPGMEEVAAIDLPDTSLYPAARLVGVFRFSGPSRLDVSTTSHALATLPTAVINAATYQSVIDADGSCRTRAFLIVNNGGEQFLRVTLPSGAKLWSIRVDGEPGKPRRAATGELLVAIPVRPEGLSVELIYEEKLSPLGTGGWMRQSPPKYAGVPVNRTTWEVFPPPGYIGVDSNGDLSPLAMTTEPLAYEKILDTGYALLRRGAGIGTFGSLASARREATPLTFLAAGQRARKAGEESEFAKKDANKDAHLHFSNNRGDSPNAPSNATLYIDQAQKNRLKQLGYQSGEGAYTGTVFDGAAAPQPQMRVYALRTADPQQVSDILRESIGMKELGIEMQNMGQSGGGQGGLGGAGGGGEQVAPNVAVGGSAGQTFTATVDNNANLVISGTPEQIAAVEKILADLDRPTDSKPATSQPASPLPVQTSAGDAKLGVNLALGRRSLPLDLQGREGYRLNFAGVGQDPTLELRLVYQTHARGVRWAIVGTLLLAALRLTTAARRTKTRFIVGVLVIASVAPLLAGRPMVGHANAAFNAGLLALAWFLAIAIVQRLLRWLQSRRGAALNVRAVTAALLLGVVLTTQSVAQAAPKTRAKSKPVAAKPAKPATPIDTIATEPEVVLPPDTWVVPYDPAASITAADKVLVPYPRYVELWNRAFPERRILLPGFLPTQASTIGARYDISFGGDTVDVPTDQPRLRINAVIELLTLADGWTRIELPLSGVSVQSSTLWRQSDAGKQPITEPAVLRACGPGLFELFIQGAGFVTLRMELTVPAPHGPRGEARFDLPPAAVGVVSVRSNPHVLMEIVNAPGGQDARAHNAASVVEAALPADGRVHLRWQPRPDANFRDDTMTAEVNSTYAIMENVLKLTGEARWSLPLSRADRFTLLLDAGLTMLRVSGPDVHDWAAVTAADGRTTVTIRLHRPVEKKWAVRFEAIGSLPEDRQAFALPAAHAAQVMRESGYVMLAAANVWTVRVAEAAGMTQIDLPAALPPAGDTGLLAVAAYRFGTLPARLRVTAVAAPQQLVADSDLAVRLIEDRRLTFFRGRVEVRQGRPHELSFTLPADLEVMAVRGPLVSEHWIEETSPRVLHVRLSTGLIGVSDVVVIGKTPLDIGKPLVIVPIELRGAERQRGRIAVQTIAPLEAAVEDHAGLLSVPTDATRDWLSPRDASLVSQVYRWDARPAPLRLRVRRIQPQVRCEILVAMSVDAEMVHHVARLRYDVSRAGQDRFSFELPNWPATHVRINAANVRTMSDAAVAGDSSRRRWVVTLAEPVTGRVEIVAAYDEPLIAGRPVEAARVTPVDAEATRWTILLAAAADVELEAKTTQGVEKLTTAALDLSLPPEATTGLTSAYRGYSPDYALSFAVTRRSEVQLDRAAVTSLEITTTAGLSGGLRGRATMQVDNRTEQYLQLQLPPGAMLWSASVAGRSVKPGRAANGDLLIPLVKTSAAESSYAVVVDYAINGNKPLSSIGWLELPSPTVKNLPVMRSACRVYLPEEFAPYWDKGNLTSSSDLELALEELERRQAEAQRVYSYVSKGGARQRSLAAGNLMSLSKSNDQMYKQIEQQVQSLDDSTRLRGKLAAQAGLNRELQEKAAAIGAAQAQGEAAASGPVSAIESAACSTGQSVAPSSAAADLPDFCDLTMDVPAVPVADQPTAPAAGQSKGQTQALMQWSELNEELRNAKVIESNRMEDRRKAERPEQARQQAELRDEVSPGKKYQVMAGQTGGKEADKSIEQAARQIAVSPPPPPARIPSALSIGRLSLPIDMPQTANVHTYSKTRGDPKLRLLLIHRDLRDTGRRTGGLLILILAGSLIAAALQRGRVHHWLARGWPVVLLFVSLIGLLGGFLVLGLLGIVVALVAIMRRARAGSIASA